MRGPTIKRKLRRAAVRRVTVSGLDRQTAESLYLELKRFCRAEGAELVRFSVREYRRKR